MRSSIFLLAFTIFLAACSEDKKHEPSAIQFPAGIDSIFLKSCATVGCHLTDEHAAKLSKSMHLPSELDLSSWTGLFEGSHNGAVVIPFNSEVSHLIAHVSGQRGPRMPPNYSPYFRDTLTQSQVNELTAWIDDARRTSTAMWRSKIPPKKYSRRIRLKTWCP